MPVTRTNTKRYVAVCPVADCGWLTEVLSVRLVASQRLRHHTKQTHGFQEVEPVEEGQHPMKVQTNTELPEVDEEKGPRLADYAGNLIVFINGWEHVTSGDRIRTQYGDRPYIEANTFVYNTETKTWDNPGLLRVYGNVLIARLIEAGPKDDLGGVLTQGTKTNAKQWDLTPPSAAQLKLLDKFDPSF